MPLHLAHHKSYHPYNRANIDKVKADEAEAKRKKDAEEGRELQVDAEARINALRRLRDSGSKGAGRQVDGVDVLVGDQQLGPSSHPGDRSEGQQRKGYETDGHINFWAHLEDEVRYSS